MLITFEGIDACGKSTQMELLAERLEKEGLDFIKARQPGGTSIGQAIRKILLDPANTEMIPETEVLLYVADRLQHIQQVIEPALKEQKIVLCDRYHDTAAAYQGAGRQRDLSWLKPIEDKFIRVPDLTLYFDITVETSQNRLEERNKTLNQENCRLEQEDVDFFDRVRLAYKSFAENEPQRFVIVDAEGNIESIQEEVVQIVLKRLGKTT
ncbi:MAG: dTMP kinase [Proteobacteria bacterium]|nr:dTMP kinase [Pseudomonadota bacterium]